jgi:cytidylate kinase
MRVSGKVSEASAIKEVRSAMVAQQEKMGKHKGIVMDGRDIGTVVFPQAELKIFMNADFNIRAERRQKELLEKGELIELDKIKENLAKRDHIDTTREESPLVKAEDGIEIDTTHVTFDEQVEQIIHLAQHEMIKT